MLTNTEKDKSLYHEVESLVESIGLKTVEVQLNQSGKHVILRIFLYKKGSEITIEDLEKSYNILYPRFSVLYHDRDLEMEITSPGIQRNFKDIMEFEVFTGKTVRVYSVKYSSYIVGKIESSDENGVTLTDYLIEDKKEKGSSIFLDFPDIAKAKLENTWESKNA